MKRIFWLLVGVGLGVYAVTRLKARAKALSPAGLNTAADKIANAVRDFGEQVREGMDQREGELREALGLDVQAGVQDGVQEGRQEKVEYGNR